jgi:predicted adenine nucleotide alpha hydrolase (AANH) superfamily ATPase
MKQSSRIVIDRNADFVTCAAFIHRAGEAPLSEQCSNLETLAFEPFLAQNKVLVDFFKIEERTNLLAETQLAIERLQRRLLNLAIAAGHPSDGDQILATLSLDPEFKKMSINRRPPLILPLMSSNFECRFSQKLGTWIQQHYQNNSETFERLSSLRFGDLEKKKILLHVCCGPDAAGVIGQLKRDYEVTCFWYDPNIQPREEHDKRRDAFLKVAEIENVKAILGEYDVENFYDQIEGLEHTPEQGAKCSQCYDLRLERAAVEAKNNHCDVYTTTLAISPHKVQEKLSRFGELNQKKYGVPYLTRNFMKDEGFKKSVEYTRDFKIYRQDYCGCYFSLPEGGKAAREMAETLGISHADMKAGLGNKFRGRDVEHPYLGWVDPATFLSQPSDSTKPLSHNNPYLTTHHSTEAP